MKPSEGDREFEADVSDSDEGGGTIIVDPLRIKVRLRPGSLGEESPASWKDVANQVNGHLMRLAAGSTRLLAEVVEGATRLVRGVSSMPSALVRRIEKFHVIADVHEEIVQEELDRGAPAASPENALKNLEAILNRYHAEGLVATLHIDENGRPIIVVVRPEHGLLAEEIVKRQLTDGGASGRPRIGS